jgi:hypothetical protein
MNTKRSMRPTAAEIRLFFPQLWVTYGVLLGLSCVMGGLQLFPRGLVDSFTYCFTIGTVLFLLYAAIDLFIFYPDFLNFKYSKKRIGCLLFANFCGFLLAVWVADHWTHDYGKTIIQQDSIRFISFYLLSLLFSMIAFVHFEQKRYMRDRQKKLLHSHLTLLSSQLEPHMLFNTMANLRALIETDTKNALTMLDALNSYLRATLNGSRVSWHPLADEFARLDDYLRLMSIRMGARLKVTLDCPAQLSQHPIPPMLLQPLVENAIKHGLEPAIAGGTLHIEAQHIGEHLLLSVSDTGMGGLTVDQLNTGKGFGLSQVRTRLKSIYFGRAQLSLGEKAGYTSTLKISVPWVDSNKT